MTTPVNRAQRRAARHQKTNPTRTGSPLAPLYLLDSARPNDPAEKAGEHLKTLARYERLRDGDGDDADFSHIGMVLAICRERAVDIDEALADIIEAGQKALIRCGDRHKRGLRYGFDGPGLMAMDYALEGCREIINASSPMQMIRARRVAVERLVGKAERGQMERMGLV